MEELAMNGSKMVFFLIVLTFAASSVFVARTIGRPVGPQDIAATIAAYLGIKPPSGSVGVPLLEVLKK
jgi:hypothetical protein